ncbi:unnamed protein product, partial [marine sediment metagenome]
PISTTPNSQNAMILYAMFLGYNQEDSSILNKQTVERGFLRGVYYKMDTIEIEKNQSVRVPRPRETMYIRNNPYNKLDESGVVEIGQMIEPGDIVVGIVVELAQVTENGKRYLDKSSTYENNETGRVVSVVTKLDGEDKFIMITYEYERSMSIGDKMSSRSGNKNVCGILIPHNDMPHTRSGMRPDIIINPASIPTRMTLAQVFETTISKLAAKKGVFLDGTVYTSFDSHELIDELEKEGLAIRDEMINGITGEMFNVALFYGPQTIMRIPKFVKEDRHAIG